eukprot:5211021-Pyramimonas_sp.AAC.1
MSCIMRRVSGTKTLARVHPPLRSHRAAHPLEGRGGDMGSRGASARLLEKQLQSVPRAALRWHGAAA